MAHPRLRLLHAVEIASAVGLVALIVHAIVPDGGRVAHFFDYRLYYALIVIAVTATIARAVFVPAHRRAWIALAVGVTSFATAEFLWLALYADDVEAPFPSVVDGFYLAFYPASYIGLILLLRTRVRSLTPGVWVDGLTAALAVGALGSAVVVEVVLGTLDGSPLATVATNIAYPLGDVILLSLIVGGFALTRWRPGRAWVLLGASLAVIAVADSVYLYAVSTGTYVEGGLLDVGWPAGLLLIGFAAWQDTGRDRIIDVRGRNFLALPAACAGIAVALLVVDHFQRLNLLAIGLASLTLASVLVRLAVTFRENRALLRQTSNEAVTDALTSLGNRRKLIADLDRAVAEATADRPWLFAIYDLNGFKGYNDTFGHPAGDALLIRLGDKLAAVFEDTQGAAYRLGGDEFCLLAPAGEKRAAHLLDASLAALTEHGEGFDVTSSYGSVLLPEQAGDGSEVLRAADQRLYAHKRLNRAAPERTVEVNRPLDVLLQALYEREPDLHRHIHDVASLSAAVGRGLGLGEPEIEVLRRAAMLHDVGKLAIPDQILHKSGALDASEWVFVRQHTVVAERILGASPELRPIGTIVRASHERWDGAGYPDGLVGEEIPLAARIVFASDAYAAMTTDRTYRVAMSNQEAIAELRAGAGTQFDPRVVHVLVEVIREGRWAEAA